MFIQGCFELYGADFVIGDDLSVWLLEINSCPALGASTHVTKRLCANVLEDTIKVVIDRKEDKGADTGQFELAFKQVPSYKNDKFSMGSRNCCQDVLKCCQIFFNSGKFIKNMKCWVLEVSIFSQSS